MIGKEDLIIENNLKLLRYKSGLYEHNLVDENNKGGDPRKSFVIIDLLKKHELISYRNGAVYLSIKGQDILDKGGWIKHNKSIKVKNNERENLEFEKLKLEIQTLKRSRRWQVWINIITIAAFVLSVILGLKEFGVF